MDFPTTGKVKTWHLPQSKVDEWQGTFDTLDVLAECRKARQWILDNPERRKTARGMVPFLGRWLTRAVDSGRGRTTGKSTRGRNEPDHSGLQAWMESEREKEAENGESNGIDSWLFRNPKVDSDAVIETSGKRLT